MQTFSCLEDKHRTKIAAQEYGVLKKLAANVERICEGLATALCQPGTTA